MVGATNSKLGLGPPKPTNGSVFAIEILLKEMCNVASLESDQEGNLKVVGSEDSQIRGARKKESMPVKGRVVEEVSIYIDTRDLLFHLPN